jgi:hypothetical protein
MILIRSLLIKQKSMRVLFFLGIFFLFFVSLSPVQAVTCETGYADNGSGLCLPTGTGLSQASVSAILLGFMNWLLAILGFIGIIAFVISGMQYLLAAGDEHTISTAKNNMKYSVIGIVVALSGFVVIQAVDAALRALPDF